MTTPQLTSTPPPHNILDLTLCSPQLGLQADWSVADDTFNSNHFPTLTRLSLSNPSRSANNHEEILTLTSQRKFPRNINWSKFTPLLDQELQHTSSYSFLNSEQKYDKFTNSIYSVLDQIYPPDRKLTTTPTERKPFPIWWTPDCTSALRSRKLALKSFRSSFTLQNILAYRQAQAVARRIFLKAKRDSWRNLCQSFNRETNISEVWKKSKIFRSDHRPPPLALSADQLDLFADTVTPTSAIDSTESDAAWTTIPCPSTHFLDAPFTLPELTATLSTKKSTAPGLDQISFAILQHLSQSALSTLLDILNSLWASGTIPNLWLHFKVIPIPKKDSQKFRPIALSSCPRKLIETMLNSRFIH